GHREDVVALLDQVELGQVEPAAIVRVSCPGVEMAAAGQVVVDQAGDDTGDQRMAVAVTLQVVLHLLRVAAHAAGAQQGFGVGGPQPGQALGQNTGDSLGGSVQQDSGHQPRGDEDLRWAGRGQLPQQIIVQGPDGAARVAVGDLVGAAGLFVCQLGGVVPVVGD